jgi:hypothetical protein
MVCREDGKETRGRMLDAALEVFVESVQNYCILHIVILKSS